MTPAGELPDARVSTEDLLRKYALLLDLREGRRAGERALLRALALEFPGALRELDAMPLDELRARRDALGQTPEPPWASWMRDYHGLMRLTLALKRALPSRRAPSVERVRLLAEAATARWGSSLGEDYLRAVHRPPAGRLGALVFATLGARFGEDPAVIWQTLFPTARADRFAPRALP